MKKRKINSYNINEYTNANHIVGIHELGHLVVARYFNRKIQDITLNKVNENLGRVRLVGKKQIESVRDIIISVTISLGGRASERVFFNTNFTGSRHDLANAFTQLQKSVEEGDFGIRYVHNSSRFLKLDSSKKVLRKTKKILNTCYKNAYKIVKKNKNTILELLPHLIDKTTLTEKDIKNILLNY